MNPDGIMTAMREKNLLLQEKNDQMVALATEKADAQHGYRTALASEIAKRRLSGESVSLSETMAKGTAEVADKKVLFVIAEAKYKSCISSIKITLAAVQTLRSLLTWEREEKYNKNV